MKRENINKRIDKIIKYVILGTPCVIAFGVLLGEILMELKYI